MGKHVLLFGLILATCTAASGQLLHPRYLGPLDPFGMPTCPTLFPGREPISLDLAKPMSVRITPLRPSPGNEVVVTISGSTFVPYLTADDVDLRSDGSDITLDIHWISSPPPLFGALSTNQLCSVGTVNELVRFELASSLRSGRYEVTQSLGTFSPGTYTLEVNSSGRLTGTVSTSFNVRDHVSSNLFDGLGGGWW